MVGWSQHALFTAVAWHPIHEGLFVSGGSDGAVMFWNMGLVYILLDHLQSRDQCKNNIFLQSSCIIPRKNFLICKDLANKSSGFDCQLSLTYRYSWYLRYQCLKYPCSTVCVLLYSLDREVGSMEEAHEGMVWSLAWHPMGHILATGSNDHST